jgi:hypothetical protein
MDEVRSSAFSEEPPLLVGAIEVAPALSLADSVEAVSSLPPAVSLAVDSASPMLSARASNAVTETVAPRTMHNIKLTILSFHIIIPSNTLEFMSLIVPAPTLKAGKLLHFAIFVIPCYCL